VAIKSHFPNGLSPLLFNAFSPLPSRSRPEFIPSTFSLDSSWIAGFINGDGSFSLGFTKKSNSRLGATCLPTFSIVQHERDRILLERIQSSLGCGKFSSLKVDGCYDLRVADIATITSKIVPFFTSHTLQGAKALDFRDFCLGIEIMNKGGHLTEVGLTKLRSLYLGMNSNRTKFD